MAVELRDDGASRRIRRSLSCGVLGVWLALSISGGALAQERSSAMAGYASCAETDLSGPKKAALRSVIAASLRWPRAKGDQSEDRIIADAAPLVRIGGLRAAHRDALVYLSGGNYCGSGGCQLLIFSDNGRYKLMSKIYSVHEPAILTTAHNGWADLGAKVSGGGAGAPYSVRLSYGRQGYPKNAAAGELPKMSQGVLGRTQADRTQEYCALK